QTISRVAWLLSEFASSINIRSNRHIFIPQDSGSPKNGLFTHITSLGQIARLDFERFNVAGDVISRSKATHFRRARKTKKPASARSPTRSRNWATRLTLPNSSAV